MHAQRAIPFQAIMGHLGVSRALAAFHFFHGSFHFFDGSNWRVWPTTPSSGAARRKAQNIDYSASFVRWLHSMIVR